MKTRATFVYRTLRLCGVAVLIALAASCHSRIKRIPGDDFQLILRDLFITDLLLERDGDLHRMADSLLVYPPILEKHGYTTESFLYTVDYYTRRPTRFKSLLIRLRKQLNEERIAYNKRREHLDKQKAFADRFNNRLKDSLTDRRNLVQKQYLTHILSIGQQDAFSMLCQDVRHPYERLLLVWEEPSLEGIPAFLEESVHSKLRRPRVYKPSDVPGLPAQRDPRLHLEDRPQEIDEIAFK